MTLGMTNRYAVVFSKWVGRHGYWAETVVARRGTLETARRLAQRIGDRHPALQVTRGTYYRKRSGVEVVDRKRRKTVWEHPGVIVPSVGELGWTP